MRDDEDVRDGMCLAGDADDRDGEGLPVEAGLAEDCRCSAEAEEAADEDAKRLQGKSQTRWRLQKR